MVNIDKINIHLTDVKSALDMIDSNKGAGPDFVPPKFYKNCGKSLALPLQLLFNLSLQSGKFPSLWKVTHVVPIHKAGSKSSIENYRPVSILSTPCKILESIVYTHISYAFKNIISLYTLILY